MARPFGLDLTAAHLHHGLRGQDADQDQAFVRDFCALHEVPLISARWNTRRRMRALGLKGQAGLRTLRREFLLRAARRLGATAVATAHTADDQLETVLLRLFRGAGLPGLGGMLPRTGIWLKPLLEATRAEIEADLLDLGQSWREDRSNADPAYARNRLRHQGIPALIQALAPGLDAKRARAGLAQRVAHAAAEAQDAQRALAVLAGLDPRTLSLPWRIQQGEIELDSERVRSYPIASQRTILRKLWGLISSAGPGLRYQHLRSLLELIESGRRKTRIALPSGFNATRHRRSVLIQRATSSVLPDPVQVQVPGLVACGNLRLESQWASGLRARQWLAARERMATHQTGEEYFAADALAGGLELRAAKADEEFIPFGRRRPVRIRQFLSKQGASRDPRSCPLVLTDSKGVLWLIGVRRSTRAPLTTGTRKALWVHAERHD